MILVDTSAWIDFFRGAGPLADEVDAALADGTAAICGPVELELRRGLRPHERTRVLPLLGGCTMLAQPADLWREAGDLGAALRRHGATVKSLDLVIATYALVHRTPVLTGDSDFLLLEKWAGVRLV